MNNERSRNLMKIAALVIIIFIVAITLLASCSGNSSKTQPNKQTRYINDSATSDTPVETLKTLTAEISAVEQQNQKLIEQNKVLTEQDKKTLAQFKNDVLTDVQKQMNEIKNTNQTTIEEAKKSLDKSNNSKSTNHNNGAVDNEIITANDNLTWVNDLQSSSADSNSNITSNSNNHLSPLNSDDQKTKNISDSNFPSNKKPSSVPYYTIPVNATLTGAIAMQPIIGRVPIDGKVPDPYTFKVVIGAKNLAANGIDIPPEIQGIVASGVAQGDMLGSCARGEITSMTFVFQDGRISTTQAKNGESLGIIAAANGNPCILGSFHSNAAIYLGAQAALAGMQGYGNALSQSQLSNSVSSTTGATISQLIGRANKYALGQGFSAASQSASHWWEQRVQNSFDFVFVPNVDQQTSKKLMLNINITQEIPIDYDPQGRKVFYAHDFNADNLATLD